MVSPKDLLERVLKSARRLKSKAQDEVSNVTPETTPLPDVTDRSFSTPDVSSPGLPNIGVQQKYQDSSFMAKVGIGAFAVLLIVSAIGGVLTLQTGSILEEQTKDSLKSDAKLQNSQVDLWRSTMTQQAQFISESTAVSSGNPSHATAYLIQQGKAMPDDVLAIYQVKEKSGDKIEVVASSNHKYKGETASSLGESSWSKIVTSDKMENDEQTIITSPYKSKIDNKPVMAFVSPVSGDNGAIVMVISLAEASTRLNAPTGGQSFVVSNTGEIILSTNPNLIGKDAYDSGYFNKDAWKQARQETSSMYTTTHFNNDITINGKKQVTGMVHIEEQNWVAVTQQPMGVAYSLSSTIQDYMLGLIIAVLFSVLGVGAVIGIPAVRDQRELADAAESVSNGNYDTEIDLGREDELGQVADSVDKMRISLRDRINEVETLHDSMETAVTEQAKAMGDAASGDLTSRMNTDTGVEQLDELAGHFNAMMTDIENAVAEAKEFGYEVSSASEEATHGVREVRSASDEVTAATQEISDGAAKQNEKLDRTQSEMNDLSGTIEEVASSADEVSRQAEETSEASEQGREAATDAADALDTIEDQTDTAVQAVEELTEEMEQISEIVGYIQDVAKQTNMLAINASIEAARAGEAGEGFAVVADQVKELADDAADAADDIEDSLDSLQNKTELTAEDIEETQDSVERGGETIEEALAALDDIANAVDDTVAGVKEIDEATERQAETAQDVVAMVDDVATISEETASQAEDVAAASEEQTASIVQVSESTQELAERSTRLSDLLDQFEVGADQTPDEVEDLDLEDDGL